MVVFSTLMHVLCDDVAQLLPVYNEYLKATGWGSFPFPYGDLDKKITWLQTMALNDMLGVQKGFSSSSKIVFLERTISNNILFENLGAEMAYAWCYA